MLIQQYLYIDRLLNSSLPHDLLNEYNSLHGHAHAVAVPATISEEPITASPSGKDVAPLAKSPNMGVPEAKRVKRTPRAIYRPAETTPLLEENEDDEHDPDEDPYDNARPLAIGGATEDANGKSTTGYGATENSNSTDTNSFRGTRQSGTESPKLEDIPLLLDEDEDVDSSAPVVTLAIYVNMAANVILLIGKMAVVLSVPSISVLASLVDAVLDFLSTAIVWTTTTLISNQDQYRYPVGRRRLEPLGVLVFSVIMITSFVQVMLEAVQRLASNDHQIIEL